LFPLRAGYQGRRRPGCMVSLREGGLPTHRNGGDGRGNPVVPFGRGSERADNGRGRRGSGGWRPDRRDGGDSAGIRAHFTTAAWDFTAGTACFRATAPRTFRGGGANGPRPTERRLYNRDENQQGRPGVHLRRLPFPAAGRFHRFSPARPTSGRMTFAFPIHAHITPPGSTRFRRPIRA